MLSECVTDPCWHGGCFARAVPVLGTRRGHASIGPRLGRLGRNLGACHRRRTPGCCLRRLFSPPKPPATHPTRHHPRTGAVDRPPPALPPFPPEPARRNPAPPPRGPPASP